MILDDTTFPNGLISPYYADNRNNKKWQLLKLGIRRKPSWIINHISLFNIFLFREIAYIDDNNQIEGFGRAWIPINLNGVKIFCKATNFFKPKPVGLVLEKKFPNNLSFEVIKKETSTTIIPPYILSKVKIDRYNRIIRETTKNNILLFTEEEFITELID